MLQRVQFFQSFYHSQIQIKTIVLIIKKITAMSMFIIKLYHTLCKYNLF